MRLGWITGSAKTPTTSDRATESKGMRVDSSSSEISPRTRTEASSAASEKVRGWFSERIAPAEGTGRGTATGVKEGSRTTPGRPSATSAAVVATPGSVTAATTSGRGGAGSGRASFTTG
nr:hypothetical protein GCM10020093_005750 [Planobispora longispora]